MAASLHQPHYAPTYSLHGFVSKKPPHLWPAFVKYFCCMSLNKSYKKSFSLTASVTASRRQMRFARFLALSVSACQSCRWHWDLVSRQELVRENDNRTKLQLSIRGSLCNTQRQERESWLFPWCWHVADVTVEISTGWRKYSVFSYWLGRYYQ